jgi:hypothetical protein
MEMETSGDTPLRDINASLHLKFLPMKLLLLLTALLRYN